MERERGRGGKGGRGKTFKIRSMCSMFSFLAVKVRLLLNHGSIDGRRLAYTYYYKSIVRIDLESRRRWEIPLKPLGHDDGDWYRCTVVFRIIVREACPMGTCKINNN
jgi:hypothetical protein